MASIGSKPLASLSSGLLARKGQARPAMRPQQFDAVAGLDDLGWNDMGQPATTAEAPAADPAPLPPVLVERDTLVAKIALDTAVATAGPIAPEELAAIHHRSAAQTPRGRAAFTLRLDAERHLRLRLASAIAHRSAQALLVQALDQLLATMPEVEASATRLPVKGASR